MSARALVATVMAGVVWLAGGAGLPTAHADDPLPPIRAAVVEQRSASKCPPMTYSGTLEAAAQGLVRAPYVPGYQVTGYNGTTVRSWGYGDPEAEAIKEAVRGAGATLWSCDYTEFGVGFIRDDGRERDTVGIVMGMPSRPPASTPSSTPPSPASAPPPPPAPKVAPTDAIDVSFTKGLQWTVNVTNSADIPGSCTYAATNPVLPGANRTFTIDRNGKASFTVLAPPPFSTYHVVVSCRGPFDGKDVEFGHFERDVSA